MSKEDTITHTTITKGAIIPSTPHKISTHLKTAITLLVMASDCRQSPGKSRAFLHLWPFFWYNRNIRRAVFFYDDKKFR